VLASRYLQATGKLAELRKLNVSTEWSPKKTNAYFTGTLQLHCKVRLDAVYRLSTNQAQSACLSPVTRVYCDKTAEARITCYLVGIPKVFGNYLNVGMVSWKAKFERCLFDRGLVFNFAGLYISKTKTFYTSINSDVRGGSTLGQRRVFVPQPRALPPNVT